ncbi:hypothetical protein ONS95_001246 [Cadophora gregata]|uniref:uncharacterized protein n=1 Tax=Cadophora gregata TaxID=51156 RepID=UPI0026DCA0E3|nr:uncharacterized protein ONS95_001246 [Cadophora gregata]KAK0101945.1 hypothetical protein ONS96_005915 [Cadophora gregata f. sp. sojae]KAK0129314.1 hypothetical protein ONS95_001246 [Cadophora gregata]
MPKTLPLLHGEMTVESALDDDDNMLQALAYPQKRFDFFVYLWKHRSEIEDIVSDHLGLNGRGLCQIGEVKDWMAGSFNVCIPVHVHGAKVRSKRVIIRFPLPYKVGELQHPGNAEEKIRSEAATFIWIQENCPGVPIPHLWGFGLPDGQSYTTPDAPPFHTRLMWYLRRTALSLLGYPVPCRYIRRQRVRALKTGYLVIDYIEATRGKMLSESWDELRHDRERRSNLFSGLSRIILSLAQSPLPRIGSLTIDEYGVLCLSNRPLTLRLQHLENEGIPTNIDRSLTYSTTDSYLLDLLLCHDSRIRNQPNSILEKFDGQAQLSALTAMRALIPHFANRDLRHGPFVLTLTDLHQSNIFVDDDWNVKCLIDLEWACSRPLEMLHPPSWLTGRGVDQLTKGEHLDAYSSVHGEFVDAFENEEKSYAHVNGDASFRTRIMRRGWTTGNFWFFHALDNPKGLYNIFLQHIQPRFMEVDDKSMLEFERTLAPYWSVDWREIIAAKIKDKEVYDDQLRRVFETPAVKECR